MAIKKKSATDEVAKINIDIQEETLDAGFSDVDIVGEPVSFCVYIGPSIRGVIQSGTIYGKTLKETKVFLATAIEKYPLIAKLISTDKTFAEDRIKVKTAGNLLNVYYKKLSSGNLS